MIKSFFNLGPQPCTLFHIPPSAFRNRHSKTPVPSLSYETFVFQNYSETVLQCYFYYDIQTLPLQRTDIPLNQYRCMYRNDIKCLGA